MNNDTLLLLAGLLIPDFLLICGAMGFVFYICQDLYRGAKVSPIIVFLAILGLCLGLLHGNAVYEVMKKASCETTKEGCLNGQNSYTERTYMGGVNNYSAGHLYNFNLDNWQIYHFSLDNKRTASDCQVNVCCS